jgi:hypothetical protein
MLVVEVQHCCRRESSDLLEGPRGVLAKKEVGKRDLT